MKGNIGQYDQAVRALVGALLILLTGLGAVAGAAKVLALVAGSVAVFTAAAGVCPLYRLVGLSTYRA
jgi:hypothetical protein